MGFSPRFFIGFYPMPRVFITQVLALIEFAFILGCSSAIAFSADVAGHASAFEVAAGQSLTLEAEVEGGQGPFHFQWFKDYAAIPGAVYPELKFEAIAASDAGSYSVTVFNDGGSQTSAPEIITVRDGKSSRLANVSVVATARDPVLVGFSLGGRGTDAVTQLLARAAGPALAQFGVTNALSDPVLTVFQNGQLISTNDDWDHGDSPAVAMAAAVGAFPFPSSSKDSAVILSLPPADYSAEVVDGSNGTGITMVELYDAMPAGERGTSRLIAISARGTIGGEDAPLTAGFTIEGEAPVTVLLRGLGPALERTGILGAAANPRLYLFRGPALISSNEDWSDLAPAEIEAAQRAVGALALDASSLDAAILVSLGPGSYTAHLSSASNAGVARIEVYEVP